MGKLRFQFKVFHKPLFGWKGSFVVTNVSYFRPILCYFYILGWGREKSFLRPWPRGVNCRGLFLLDDRIP